MPFIPGVSTTTTASAVGSVVRAMTLRSSTSIDPPSSPFDVGVDVHHDGLERGPSGRPRRTRTPGAGSWTTRGPASARGAAGSRDRARRRSAAADRLRQVAVQRHASTTSWMPGTVSRASCSIAISALRRRSASRTAPAARTSAASPWAIAMATVEAPVPPGPVTANKRGPPTANRRALPGPSTIRSAEPMSETWPVRTSRRRPLPGRRAPRAWRRRRPRSSPVPVVGRRRRGPHNRRPWPRRSDRGRARAVWRR